MEEKDLGKIVVVQDGVEKECDVLFTFNCEELGKKYFAFTDNSISSNGRKNIYVSSYDSFMDILLPLSEKLNEGGE